MMDVSWLETGGQVGTIFIESASGYPVWHCGVCDKPAKEGTAWSDMPWGERVCSECYSWAVWRQYPGTVDAEYFDMKVILS